MARPRTTRSSKPTRPKARPARARAAAGVQSAAERRRVTQQLRALAHPLRLRLVEMFADTPRTTMQVAALMGEPPTRLYHHVNALERAGILKLTRTRQVRGTTEKYYVRQTTRFTVGSGGGRTPSARAAVQQLAAVVFDQARGEVLARLQATTELTEATAPVALRMVLSMPPEELPKVRARILALMQELKTAYDHVPGAEHWALTIGYAPTGARKK